MRARQACTGRLCEVKLAACPPLRLAAAVGGDDSMQLHLNDSQRSHFAARASKEEPVPKSQPPKGDAEGCGGT